MVAPERQSNRAVWIFGGVLAIGAILLFLALDSNRRALVAPATSIDTAPDGTIIASPPELAIPQQFDENPFALRPRPDLPPAQLRPIDPAQVATPPKIIREVVQAASANAGAVSNEAASAAFGTAPSVVFDARRQNGGSTSGSASGTGGNQDSERVRAGRLANPAMTVPQGTVLPAVLETALDSTRPGAVRAIVSRDIRGFDGSRILIPRGSRLYGEYEASLAAGQNRALIRWTRLVRPDGALIALDSPASDPLGRAGVKGKVDSKFFQRFGGAILQSVLDIGVGVATREAAGDAVVVALPGSTQNIANATQLQQNIPQPTLKVRHGKSVSVFVARDLDFSTVES